MRHMIRFAVCLGLLGVTLPAAAADASRFDGYYAGVFVGYGAVAFDGVVDSGDIDDGDPEEAEIFDGEFVDSLMYGGFVGFNKAVGSMLYGVELNLGAGSAEALAVDDVANDYSTNRLGYLVSLQGRAGVAVTPSTLLFASAGVGLLASTFTANNYMDDIQDAETSSISIFIPGLVFGAGIEQAITDTIAFRIDGTYFLGGTTYEFEHQQLTGDMDLGDYAAVDGFYRITAGLSFAF